MGNIYHLEIDPPETWDHAKEVIEVLEANGIGYQFSVRPGEPTEKSNRGSWHRWTNEQKARVLKAGRANPHATFQEIKTLADVPQHPTTVGHLLRSDEKYLEKREKNGG